MKALALKYRPETFDDVVEQKAIRQILQEQVATKTHKHAYLFTGGAGTGKTTCARILANEINAGKGKPIEIDAASNNGVDDVREIINDAKFKALDAEYKVYILDECFYKNTPILLADGTSLPISDIEVGTQIKNMVGTGVVKNVFKNLIPLERLCIIRLTDASHILTTKDHLFFTDSGWIEASELTEEDIIYEGITMHDMQKAIYKQDLSKDVLQGVYEETDSENRKRNNADKEGNVAKAGEFGTNEGKQSHAQKGKHTKNDSNKNPQRNIKPAIQNKGRQWNLHDSTAEVVPSTSKAMGIRVCNSYKSPEGEWVPNIIQSRPCLTRENDSDRGGWESPQLEKEYIKRHKENGIARRVRVASIEVYERGNNEQCFSSYIGDTEKSTGLIEMFDLEVSNHSSYFANNLLVHNCHMFSVGAWNAMLKLIEEPPAKTIFIFCTTDPQKIPATILSRVQRYDFQRITYGAIVERLKLILAMEADDILSADGPDDAISWETEAIEYIAKMAEGGMRDAITLLDKCLSYSPHVTLTSVLEVLGAIDYNTMFDLALNIFNGKTDLVITEIEEIHRAGIDLKQFMRQFCWFLLDVCKYGLLGSFEYLQLPETYKKSFDGWTDETFYAAQKLMDNVLKLNNQIKWDSNPKAIIEVSLILYCEADYR